MHHNAITVFFVVFFLLIFNTAFAQVEVQVTESKDSATLELVKEENDSTQKTERLEDILTYNSDDQIHERAKKMSYLLRKAKVQYQDLDISADYIEINWETGDVYAVGKQDSLGTIVEPTIFKQGGNEYESQAINFNFKTKKGIARNVRTSDTDGVIVVNDLYRVNDSISYSSGLKYTTDTYFKDKKTDDPDYYIQANEGKILDQKSKDKKTIIARDIILKVHDVPTPLVLPFIYLPIGQDRSAGILIPSFGERNEVGFFLEGLGFYVPLGDYVDLAVTADIFTRGSWGIHATSQYKKRYKFSGNFRFDYENRVQGIKGIDTGQNAFSRATIFQLNWSHRQDPKANPSLIFAANVNYSSSEFFRNTINNNNILNGNVLTNTISSSISLNKTFDNSPFSAALTLSHSQNNNNSTAGPAPVNFTLPQLTVNMARVYPFAPKTGSKKGLIQNFNFNYNFNFQNLVETNEDDAFTSRMFDNARNGARHQLNFNTGITFANYFPVNFTMAYNETWYLETILRRYDAATDTVVDEVVNGFDSFRTFNLSSNVQTNIYGIAQSKNEDSFIQGIRHVMSPSIGVSFTPDFASEFFGYYTTYRGADGNQVVYNRFEQGIFGGPSQGLNASVNFALNNNLEMKVRSKKDSAAVKKIKIFDFLNLSTAYNLAADSLNLSPVNITGATSLFDNKLRVNFSALVDVYRLNFEEGANSGTFINEFGDIRVSRYNVNLGYGFDNETFQSKEEKEKRNKSYKKRGAVRQEGFYFDENNYAKFAIPWRLDMTLNHTYTLGQNRNPTRRLSVGVSGTVSPTPYWSIRASTDFDFIEKEFVIPRFTFQRDLRSFNMTFSWVPFGQFQTYNFFIGIKSNILSDAVKYDQDSSNQLRGNF